MNDQNKSNFFQGMVYGIAVISSVGLILMLILFFTSGNKDSSSELNSNKSAVNNADVLGNNNAVKQPVPSTPLPIIDLKVSQQDHVRGNQEAPVTVIEYSDFQCPFCSRFHETMKQVMVNYPEQVRWIYRHFPLESIHPYARKAAEASECAAEQDKFWEYTDYIFENQSALSNDTLSSFAVSMGLNKNKFEECLSSGKYKEKVDEDYQSGASLGVRGTPGNFINGQSVPGALPYDQMADIIDNLLKK